LSVKVESSQMQIELRRSKVAELDSQGHSQPEISRILHVSIGTVNRDLSILRQQAKTNIKRYIDERLPDEYEKCLVGLNSITKEAWNTAHNTEDKREKIQALSLAKDCYSMKLDLLTNATVVDGAIRFVSKSKENLKSSSEDLVGLCSCYGHQQQKRARTKTAKGLPLVQLLQNMTLTYLYQASCVVISSVSLLLLLFFLLLFFLLASLFR
jgi:hypothetical protein